MVRLLFIEKVFTKFIGVHSFVKEAFLSTISISLFEKILLFRIPNFFAFMVILIMVIVLGIFRING